MINTNVVSDLEEECIAAFTKRPLMILTTKDIGTEPAEVEFNLSSKFKTAKSWGVVILIDEADVFMERRSTSDLTRNSLVAGESNGLLPLIGLLNSILLQDFSEHLSSTKAYFSLLPTELVHSTTPLSLAYTSSYSTLNSMQNKEGKYGRHSLRSWTKREETICACMVALKITLTAKRCVGWLGMVGRSEMVSWGSSDQACFY